MDKVMLRTGHVRPRSKRYAELRSKHAPSPLHVGPFLHSLKTCWRSPPTLNIRRMHQLTRKRDEHRCWHSSWNRYCSPVLILSTSPISRRSIISVSADRSTDANECEKSRRIIVKKPVIWGRHTKEANYKARYEHEKAVAC
ncbi:hypothetical protein BDN67DRAFT_973875 [Paxillus ammoniavirescens]|nr:hypothetical protein BDN67DRAFT_973875 [Paxillus ammoniavirescens]